MVSSVAAVYYSYIIISPTLLFLLHYYFSSFKLQVESSSIRYIMQEKIHMKYPGEDGSMGIKWHQDWAFLPHTNDSIVTVGLAVDDSNKENGV